MMVLLFLLFMPAFSTAADQKTETNVNERYTVESVETSGVSESKISKTLRDDMQHLVGEKYNQEAAHDLAGRLRKELREYSVKVKVKRGDKPDHVKVIFETERVRWRRFEIEIPPVLYTSKEGFSGQFDIPITIRHNVFAFGMVSNSDDLLARYSGIRLRYEHKRVGTDAVQLRINFDSYHQMWNAATEAALAGNPEVPGIYRWRQDFAPSVSVIPWRDLRLTVGTSFERFQTQYPVTHTQTAYAGTAGVRYLHDVQDSHGFRQQIGFEYNLRTATRVLDSDFVYTRHSWTTDYTATVGRNRFGAHFQAGLITGTAPLFERFSLGNSYTLRGWNKFDVAPIGGTRAAHGTLEYRYRPFQVFYDVGAVWDRGSSAEVRHSLGFGIAERGGFFASLAFPMRLHDVTPIFMLGFRK